MYLVLGVFALCASHLGAVTLQAQVPGASVSTSASGQEAGLLSQATSMSNQPRPSRTLAQRITVLVEQKLVVPFDEPLISVTVVDPEPLAAEIAEGGRSLRLIGLSFGETLLLVQTPRGRRTLIVEVVGRSLEAEIATSRRNSVLFAAQQLERGSGSYNVSFAPKINGNEAFLAHQYAYRYKLSKERTLEVQGNLFQRFGNADRMMSPISAANFQFDRISVALRSKQGTLDLMDSELNISPLTLSGYAMRGVHLRATPDFQIPEAEFFAGIARPSYSLFDNSRAWIFGALAPIVKRPNWRVRSGVIAAIARGAATAAMQSPEDLRNAMPGGGGLLFHTDARFSRTDDTFFDVEADVARSGLSWRADFGWRRGAFNFNGEASQFDGDSPLIAAGAQSGGRSTQSFGLQWQPSRRFGAATSYNRSASNDDGNNNSDDSSSSDSSSAPRLTGYRRAALSSATWLGSLYFTPTPSSQFSVRFADQILDATTTAADHTSLPRTAISTRSLAATWSQSVGGKWNNNLEVQANGSRNRLLKTEMEHGWSVREELRHSWEAWSASLFFSHVSSAESLESLVARTPSLLPEAVREIYDRNPIEFINVNRGQLAGFLPGVELPERASTDLGLRIQGTLKRFNLSNEVRYSQGSAAESRQRNLHFSSGASVRLDAANSFSVNASRSFAIGNRGAGLTSIVMSYTHFFGGAAQSGLSITKLLKLDRGSLTGRAYFDLNGNGQNDANEPGVAQVEIKLDGKRSAVTDADGHFNFKRLAPGEHTVALISDDLGTVLRASTATEQQVSLSARQNLKVDFGFTNFGFVAGRVFNDLRPQGSAAATTTSESTPNQTFDSEALTNAPGVSGVRLRLLRIDRPKQEHSALQLSVQSSAELLAKPASAIVVDNAPSYITDDSGSYEFRHLTPGEYKLEIDSATLPPDFEAPTQTTSFVTVRALDGIYRDLPLTAQRAVSGVVFVDRNANNQFDIDTDEAVSGARIIATLRSAKGAATTVIAEATTNAKGGYILRRLPAGKLILQAATPLGSGPLIDLELAPEPTTRRGINFLFKPQAGSP